MKKPWHEGVVRSQKTVLCRDPVSFIRSLNSEHSRTCNACALHTRTLPCAVLRVVSFHDEHTTVFENHGATSPRVPVGTKRKVGRGFDIFSNVRISRMSVRVLCTLQY